MPVTPHIDGVFTCPDTGSTLYFKVRYRLMGESAWESFNIVSSGTTFSFNVTTNLIYDVQVINVDGVDNEASGISQQIVITDPDPTLYPTNISLGYTFSNLSHDMDTYTCSIAEFSTPGSIIATHVLTPSGTITDTFTGLDPLTKYYLTITPAANQFYRTFSYIFTTEAFSSCANPQNTTANLV